jgi:hypothetical protein
MEQIVSDQIFTITGTYALTLLSRTNILCRDLAREDLLTLFLEFVLFRPSATGPDQALHTYITEKLQ